MGLKVIPDAVTIPSGFEPKSDNQHANNQLKNCLLFVLHVSAPPYIYFNYGFIINEKDVSENDKLAMRINDLMKENESLKKELNDVKSVYEQRINSLQESLQRLEERVDREMKEERMDLDLINDWTNFGQSFSKAEAIKRNGMVYLVGMVKGGSATYTITTLPHGWRPNKDRFFTVTHGSCTGIAIRIDANTGNVYANSNNWSAWISLDGISFPLT